MWRQVRAWLQLAALLEAAEVLSGLCALCLVSSAQREVTRLITLPAVHLTVLVVHQFGVASDGVRLICSALAEAAFRRVLLGHRKDGHL